MKIGILTLPFNNNYGGFLQAYALQTVLEEKGHEVVIVNRRGRTLSFLKRIKRAIRNLIDIVMKFEYHALGDPYEYKGMKMHKFVNKYMHLSQPLHTSAELHKFFNDNKLDAVVVGSDQLWRPDFVPNVEDYFLGYLSTETKKYSYAASFGVKNPVYTPAKIKSCGEAIRKFDIVTLREKSGIDVFEKFGWNRPDAKVVIDPTMLLDSDHYNSLIKDYTTPKSFIGKVLNYVLDSNVEIERLIDSIEKELNIQSEYIINPKKWKQASYIFPSIEEWLCAFRDAEFVITDSFHGTVFSILYHKPFIAYANNDRGVDRFITLLETFNLCDHLVLGGCNIENSLTKRIDWTYVDSVLNKKRKEFPFE